MKNTDHPNPDAGSIRHHAKKFGLAARKDRKDGKWYFFDVNNHLASAKDGLFDAEAAQFLQDLSRKEET